MSKLKVGIISQARIGSSRLPGKTLLEIGDKTLLELHLEKLLKSNYPVFLATTNENGSEKLVQIAEKLEIKSKIGSTDDVLSRFYITAKEYDLDVIVRVTSDCPFISGSILNEAIGNFLNFSDWNQIYYTNTIERKFPRGFDFEIFSMDLLRMAHLNCIQLSHREHVTPYLYSKSDPSITIKNFQYKDYGISDWRLCVDTAEDFELIKKLISDNIYNDSYAQFANNLLTRNNLKFINSSVIQKELNKN